jgi:glycogen debranching enzyme
MINGLQLQHEKNLCFSFTDKNNTYLMMNVDSPKKSDGIIRALDTLFYDVCIVADEKLYTRFDKDAVTTLYPSFYTVDFPRVGIRLTISLLPNALYMELSSLLNAGGSVCIEGMSVPKNSKLVLLCSKFMYKRCQSAGYPRGSKKLCFHIAKIYDKKSKYVRVIDTQCCVFDFDKNITFGDLAQTRFRSYCHSTENFLRQSMLDSGDCIYNSACRSAQLAGRELVTGSKSRGIWAGLPWFRDNWGRDTFIALPGILLSSGEFIEARNVIESFAQYQDKDENSKTYGRIPNKYNISGEVIYNTIDANLWFVREVLEYSQYTADVDFLRKIFPVVKLALESDRMSRTDELGFLCHEDADTWMDARYKGGNAFSPRGNRAVEIQILWHTALLCGAYIADLLNQDSASEWRKSASLVHGNFIKYFWNPDKAGNLDRNERTGQMADCLLVDGTPDFRCRPNQLLTLTVPFRYLSLTPFISDEIADTVVRTCTQTLLFPYGICSLDQHDPYFHPFHEGVAKYHKDAAYHNGTIWGWNAGFTISALTRCGFTDLAWKLSKNLSHQILDIGCVGSMSETLNAWPGLPNRNGAIGEIPLPTGAWSQAWSVSEFVRNAFQDYLGLEPELLIGKVHVCPHLPTEWLKKGGEAFTPMGLTKKSEGLITSQSMIDTDMPISGLAFNWSVDRKNRCCLEIISRMREVVHLEVTFLEGVQNIDLAPTKKHKFIGTCVGQFAQNFDENGNDEPLEFAQPDTSIVPPVLKKKNYLQSIVQQKK